MKSFTSEDNFQTSKGTAYSFALTETIYSNDIINQKILIDGKEFIGLGIERFAKWRETHPERGEKFTPGERISILTKGVV